MKGRGDLHVHRWVLERALMEARKRRQTYEMARARKLLAGIDKRLGREVRA